MTRRGWLLFATLSVCWGIPYLFIRIAVTDLDPLHWPSAGQPWGR